MEKASTIRARLSAFRQRHRAVFEFVSYALLGLLASAAELAVFALCNYWLFNAWKETDFHWWILNYEAGTGGGLGGFLATAVSYLVGQAVNFVIQRRTTFRANNDPVKSGVLFAVFITLLWFFQVYMNGVLMRAFEPPLGENLGDFLAKLLTMFLCFLVSFPVNKFVIMRRTEKKPKAPSPPR